MAGENSQSQDIDAKGSKMTVTQLTIITTASMMGSGIIMLPSQLARVGSESILSWLVTLTGALALSYGFARCGMFAKNQKNGMGGYAENTFGKDGNFIANYTYAISLVIANVAVAVTTVGYGAVAFNIRLTPLTTALWVVGIVIITTVGNFWGPRITGRINAITVWGIIIPVAFLSIFGWFWFHPDIYALSWNPNHYGLGKAISTSIPITLWSFLGLESAAADADVVEDPEKNVPIAVLVGTIFAGAVYILSTNAIQGILPNQALAAASDTAPFGLVFASIFPASWHLGTVVEILMVLSCLGHLVGWQFTVAEVFRSSANAGYFPAIFKKRTKYAAPLWGMLILMVAQIILAFGTMNPSLNAEFNNLVNICVVTNLVPYILDMSAVKMIQIDAEHWKKDSVARLSWWIAIVGGIYSLYCMYSCGSVMVMWGAIITFFGWIVWGTIAHTYRNAKHIPDPVAHGVAEEIFFENKDTKV